MVRHASFAPKNPRLFVTGMYSHPEFIHFNREDLHDYLEIYVDTQLDVVKTRYTKGLYEKAMMNTGQNVLGIDIPYHSPDSLDLVMQPLGVKY